MSTFEITIDQGVLTLTGVLSYTTITPVLYARTLSLLSQTGESIYVNLDKLTQSDSAGVALLVSWVKYAQEQSKNIVFLNMPEQIRAIVRVSGLEKLLPLQ